MQNWFYFFLKDTSSIAEGIEELVSHKIEELSVLEDIEEGKMFFCGRGEGKYFPASWKHMDSLQPIPSEIDWNQQWELFCPYFKEGICKIPLSDFYPASNKTLVLLPGAGFGDLSHPTTFLMMQLMGMYVEDQVLVDLGCGSGVLGLFGLLLGAKKVYSLDIEQDALLHTKENAKANALEDFVVAQTILSEPLDPRPNVMLLNMTFEEQKIAISSFVAKECDLWITSGILDSQEKEYINFMKQFSLRIEKILEKDGWIACIFSRV